MKGLARANKVKPKPASQFRGQPGGSEDPTRAAQKSVFPDVAKNGHLDTVPITTSQMARNWSQINLVREIFKPQESCFPN